MEYTVYTPSSSTPRLWEEEEDLEIVLRSLEDEEELEEVLTF